jgi:hypothetical protein
MTFKDLQSLVIVIPMQNKMNWSTHEHKLQLAATNGNCCFNHIIRLLTANENKFDEEVRRWKEERRGFA